MFQNIDKDIQYINGIQKMKTYYIVLFSNLEMKVCTEIKLSFISQVLKMMKFIFLNATHTVSIYNRNTLTHIESHCIILLGAILLILLPCVILSLINCSSSFLVVFCTSCCVFKRTVMLIYFYYKWRRTSKFCSKYKKCKSC